MNNTPSTPEKKNKWIKITDTKVLPENVIREWKHPEFGIIKGCVVRYAPHRDNGYNETEWIYPEPDPVSQADITLSEFTHYRILFQPQPKEETKTSETDKLYDIIEQIGLKQLPIEKGVQAAFEIGANCIKDKIINIIQGLGEEEISFELYNKLLAKIKELLPIRN